MIFDRRRLRRVWSTLAGCRLWRSRSNSGTPSIIAAFSPTYISAMSAWLHTYAALSAAGTPHRMTRTLNKTCRVASTASSHRLIYHSRQFPSVSHGPVRAVVTAAAVPLVLFSTPIVPHHRLDYGVKVELCPWCWCERFPWLEELLLQLKAPIPLTLAQQSAG
ncbi:hypothetical protein BR93DRAFT_484786 [Coniochaeta sp. PMI_546]|nr:hypothetical protein BR93DRAFT_484786 [Coniochaeta sp. PMI_546]